MGLTSEIPSNWSEVTIWHTLVFYTFLPLMALGFMALLATAPAWYFGIITFKEAIYLPWGIFAFMVGYIALLGDYVMPAETYRKYRSGELD